MDYKDKLKRVYNSAKHTWNKVDSTLEKAYDKYKYFDKKKNIKRLKIHTNEYHDAYANGASHGFLAHKAGIISDLNMKVADHYNDKINNLYEKYHQIADKKGLCNSIKRLNLREKIDTLENKRDSHYSDSERMKFRAKEHEKNEIRSKDQD